ncbi:hypothetical protein AAFC00_003199 [Neodothiora populina]|uniref:ethanolamine kinase n=1 Tax=Neodothiora populina TaxID=2781224 RepID=A0ABR3PAY4_9PEZI
MDWPILRTDSPMALRHINSRYNNADSEQSALHLLYALYPDWEHSEGSVEFVRFTDGITNTLLKAVKKRPGLSKEQIEQDAVLLRAYGKGTDVLIDRERETRSHSLLASRGLAPRLLARFENGLLYRFIAGDVCSPEDLRRPQIYRAVAKRLAQWHSTLPISAISSTKRPEGLNGSTEHGSPATTRPTPNLWTVIQAWIDALPAQTQQDKDRIQTLKAELVELSSKLGQTPGLDGNDYVFSHCDLLSGNVIVTDSASNDFSVDFIDYEYATPAPAAFDIANHLAEWGGFDCDYNALPTRSQRREFLTEYLRSYRTFAPSLSIPSSSQPSTSEPQRENSSTTASEPAPEFQQELSQLMDQVDLFRGVPGFYWGIWALIQAQISQIDFDYASYAEVRLGEYWAWKDASSNGGDKAAGKETPLRERRWAQEE